MPGAFTASLPRQSQNSIMINALLPSGIALWKCKDIVKCEGFIIFLQPNDCEAIHFLERPEFNVKTSICSNIKNKVRVHFKGWTTGFGMLSERLRLQCVSALEKLRGQKNLTKTGMRRKNVSMKLLTRRTVQFRAGYHRGANQMKPKKSNAARESPKFQTPYLRAEG